MNQNQTFRKEQDTKAARAIAPVANWVKPSRSEISLPGTIKPTFAAIQTLQDDIARERPEKLQLQNQLAAQANAILKLQASISRFIKDEAS